MVTNQKINACQKQLSHFDVAPTILDLLGIMPNEPIKFGLGTSVISKNCNLHSAEHLKFVTDMSILNHSLAYDKLWLSRDLDTGGKEKE